MTKRIAINGLGRIGRHVLRHALQADDLQVVAVNDLVSADHLAYLLKFDSTHGKIRASIESKQNKLIVNDVEIEVYNQMDPSRLPWQQLKIDYVVEATGRFNSKEEAIKHIEAGARRVVLTAPAKGDGIGTFVMGVNHTKYDPTTDHIVSNASCTTNCLAPMTKILLDHYGIEEGLMTTVHAMTAVQAVVDGASRKDWRAGRGASQNIIPASTGAAKAVGLCLPEVQGKLTGMAFRVPVADVSVVDLTVRLSTPTTYADICKKMREASEGNMQGIIEYCDEQVVSSDFISSTASCIFDSLAGIALNNHFFKLVAWYDNEMSYAIRIVDLIRYISSQENKE